MKRLITQGVLALSLIGIASTANAAVVSPAGGTVTTTTGTGTEGAITCVHNGYDYWPAAGDLAVGKHCLTTPDTSTVPNDAPNVATKTLADLTAVERSTPLDPAAYLAQGTMATRDVSTFALASNSAAIAAYVPTMPTNGYGVITSVNNGGVLGGGVDEIPIYTVDSSNPHQTFSTFTTTDARVTTKPKLTSVTTGPIPLPTWAKPSAYSNPGKDNSLAVFDKGTGILRAYYKVTKNSSTGNHTFASSAYLYTDGSNLTQDNYWLSYIQGTSSVVGLANELTQISAKEVAAGSINHMVSVTFPDAMAGVTSFPAKQSDGASTNANAPAEGQVFRIPKSENIDAWAAGKLTKMIAKAVQKYGGIVSDKNSFSMAFNMQSALDAAPGTPPLWVDGSPEHEAIEYIYGIDRTYGVNDFPWAKTEWLPVNHAAHDPSMVPGAYTPVQPSRLLDTRNGTGAPLATIAAGGTINLKVTGRGGIPATGVGAVALQVMATQPTADGTITAYATGSTVPATSNLSFAAGKTVSNLVVAQVSATGYVSLKNVSTGTVHLVADAAGSVAAGVSSKPGAVVPVTPSRILDSATNLGTTGALPANASRTVQVAGLAGVPASGASAVLINLRLSGATASGTLTAHASGTTKPAANNMNYASGAAVSNLVLAQLGADGKIALANGGVSSVHVQGDVVGYVRSGAPTMVGGLSPLTPARVLDTRTSTGITAGQPLAAGATLNLSVAGVGGVPATGVSAVPVNVTATAGSTAGFLTVYPSGTTLPNASVVNYTTGQTVPVLHFARVGRDGKISITNTSSGTVHVIVDVQGAFAPGVTL